MRWSHDAENAVKKVPFFVRKKVRKKVEAHAASKGKISVDLTDVNELKKKFLSKGGMENQIKGYDVSVCFGGSGCPNAAFSTANLAAQIEKILKKADILLFLKASVKTDLKFHHEFRVVLSDCPNACSRPQIADIGIIGAVQPSISSGQCTQCCLCVDACREDAVSIDEKIPGPVFDIDRCLMCNACVKACPENVIVPAKTGYRILLGGRLGRHPRLAMEVPGIHDESSVLEIVEKCLLFYKNHSTNGARFSHLLESVHQIY